MPFDPADTPCVEQPAPHAPLPDDALPAVDPPRLELAPDPAPEPVKAEEPEEDEEAEGEGGGKEEEEADDRGVVAAREPAATQDPLKLYVRQIGDGRLLT